MSRPQPTTDPFERYTDRANTVITLAHHHAWRRGWDSVDTEHLLLAIADAGSGTAAMALAALRVSLDYIRQETAALAQTGQGGTGKGTSTQFTAAASAVLDRARREANTMGHQYVATDHLLLALTAQTGSVAAQVLASLGVDADRLRAQVVQLLNAYTRARQTADEPAPEQVVAGRRFALPVALSRYNDDIAEARWQKELAIDDQDFEPAAAWRDEEKRLLAAKSDLVKSWADAIGTLALVDEIDRLYHQAEQLRDLLHHHDIPVELPVRDRSRDTVRRERRPPPTATPTAAGDRSTHARADHTVGQPAPPVDSAAEPVAVAPQDSVNVRGWLEGDHDQIALVRRFIAEAIHQNYYNFCWRFPLEQNTGYWYAFYGAHIPTAAVGWFAEQLGKLATLAPETADNQLRGLFIATRSDGETTHWLVRNRQVETAPGGPY
jgi:Clp amino terminal domain, pathogenicity island component